MSPGDQVVAGQNFTVDYSDDEMLHQSFADQNLTLAKHNDSEVLRMPSEVVHQITLMSFFMLIGLIGNLSVLIHLIRIHGWQRPVTIFVMSLAVSDILIAIFSMSTEILWEAFGEWIFGNVACKTATYVQCLLFDSTAFILMSMSYDRYEAICKPMMFSRSLARSQRMIGLSWVLAVVLALPQIFIFVQVQSGEHSDGTPKYSCKSQGYTAEWQRKVYVTWVAACVFLIPLAFVAYCYINIAVVVWRNTSPYTCKGIQNGEQLILRRNNSHKDVIMERTKVRTIQLTVCILSCYIICWTPYFSMNLLNVWTDYKYRNNIPSFLKSLAKCLAWFSSCVNPIIYGGFHIPYRPLQSILCPTMTKKSREQEGSCRTSIIHQSPRSARSRTHSGNSTALKTFKEFCPKRVIQGSRNQSPLTLHVARANRKEGSLNGGDVDTRLVADGIAQPDDGVWL